jgi:hypothetical protein
MNGGSDSFEAGVSTEDASTVRLLRQDFILRWQLEQRKRFAELG